MTPTPRTRARPAGSAADQERWADLADLVLIIAREIQFRGYSDAHAIPLSQSEGMVMRYLQQDGSAPPSRIAAATGLQRTNLSTVLRGLESKRLIERHAGPGDGRGVTVRATRLGRDNYKRVRREWATAVAAAAPDAALHLEPALELLAAVEAGLTHMRP